MQRGGLDRQTDPARTRVAASKQASRRQERRTLKPEGARAPPSPPPRAAPSPAPTPGPRDAPNCKFRFCKKKKRKPPSPISEGVRGEFVAASGALQGPGGMGWGTPKRSPRTPGKRKGPDAVQPTGPVCPRAPGRGLHPGGPAGGGFPQRTCPAAPPGLLHLFFFLFLPQSRPRRRRRRCSSASP